MILLIESISYTIRCVGGVAVVVTCVINNDSCWWRYTIDGTAKSSRGGSKRCKEARCFRVHLNIKRRESGGSSRWARRYRAQAMGCQGRRKNRRRRRARGRRREGRRVGRIRADGWLPFYWHLDPAVAVAVAVAGVTGTSTGDTSRTVTLSTKRCISIKWLRYIQGILRYIWRSDTTATDRLLLLLLLLLLLYIFTTTATSGSSVNTLWVTLFNILPSRRWGMR